MCYGKLLRSLTSRVPLCYEAVAELQKGAKANSTRLFLRAAKSGPSIPGAAQGARWTLRWRPCPRARGPLRSKRRQPCGSLPEVRSLHACPSDVTVHQQGQFLHDGTELREHVLNAGDHLSGIVGLDARGEKLRDIGLLDACRMMNWPKAVTWCFCTITTSLSITSIGWCSHSSVTWCPCVRTAKQDRRTRAAREYTD